MKPDGVTTAPSEPMEAQETEPVAEAIGHEGESQDDTTASPSQPDKSQNEHEAPAAVKEAPGNAVDPKSKPKCPVKGKTTVTGTVTTGPGTRPKATQSRVANGLTKTAANTATKKPVSATTAAAEKKKPATAVGATKKPVGSSAAVATSRTQPKVTTVATNRSTTTTTTAIAGAKTGTTVNTATALNRRPATATTSAATKPKTTAPASRPAAAPAAKPSTSSSAKTTTAPKTNRITGSSASRLAATSATGRPASSTTTSTVAKTSRTATQQAVKPTVTASVTRKDVSKTGTTAPTKKPVASTISRPAPSKPSNADAPKPAAPTKRPPPTIKAPQPKPDDRKSVPTRKVPPSPRNVPSRPTSSKTVGASPSHKQAGGNTTGIVKLQPSKPTQSVLPLVKGKSDTEPAAESVQLSAAAVATVAVATAAAITTEGSVLEPETISTVQLEGSLDDPTSASLDVLESIDVQVPNANSQIMLDIPNTEPVALEEALIEVSPVEVASPTSSAVTQECEEQGSVEDDEKPTAVAQATQEALLPETTTASLFDNPAATIAPSVGIDVTEKAELINNGCFEDVEEEEREGSQQVSLSEMSGTQPTEESRPGSAGLAGSVCRAGALLSEFDSEDVSCSQQGASELSAPGVLEGTESMDDLGDASLKGADGEGVSVGSPDFEKVPDILTNEDDEDDDDDDDRVCDMEVGSERAEDSHRQHQDNEDDEEDEDVEMASEGITESGLESYGNADEDDFAEDYRLDNLNRMHPHPVVASAPPAAQWNQSSCFADPWAQPPQPASTLLSSPSSEPWQTDLETPTQASAQARMDVSSSERGPSSPHPPNLFEPPPCFSEQAQITAAVGDVSPKMGLTPPQATKSQTGILGGPEQGSLSERDAGIPEEVKQHSCLDTEMDSKGQLHPEPLNPVPTVLPDIMQDLGIHLEHVDDEEEPETLPADDVLGGPATAPASAPSSPSSATEDEASDTEGEMQISDPQPEPLASVNDTAPVAHSLSTLEEREEVGGETEGGGGSDTPQSAASAASYGFDYMTSNSNAQSSAESCSKSPGIFSLENEEQLPDEAKDLSLLKELTLIPTAAPGEKIDPVKIHDGEPQSHLEQQYMLCGESAVRESESELPEPDSSPRAGPLESGLIDSSSPQHLAAEQDPDTQHPYYSTICEKTDSPLAGRNSHFPPQLQDVLSIQMPLSSKLRLRPRATHVNQPLRLPTDLPPRIPNVGSNTQLQCLEQHQQQLHQIQQRQEKRNWEQERQEEEERRAKEEELEKQRRDLLELQLKQQEQELKQRQQIIQWQQELEQQQQPQQQQKQHKMQTTVLSPLSGLSTIYEALETSDEEEEEEEEEAKRVVETEKAEDESTNKVHPEEDKQGCLEKDDLYSHCTTPSPSSTNQDSQQDQRTMVIAADQHSPPQSPSGSPERPPPLEFEWGKKVDIVQQLINQTLLLTGDGCSPLILLPGGAGGTLSPLESSLWPNLLPPLTPPSATVTSVSSFSPEAPGSSAQGEWTVVELETHH